MIGDMIAKARLEKGMSKTELARLTNINIGHLTHIEKGERNPSHKALKNICNALKIPYQQLMYTYDKQISEEQEKYGSINYISYNKILSVDNINNFIDCPANMSSASLALRVPDSSMEPTYRINEYVFIEFNTLLDHKDVGLFSINNKIRIRRFYNRKNKITLKADNKNFSDVIVSEEDEFYIIGKILK